MSLYVPYYRPFNKHNTNINAPGGIRTYNPASERPQTHALDRTATGIGTGSNPDLRSERPATNRLSHGTACTYSQPVLEVTTMHVFP